MNGYVYILSNPGYADQFKVGCSGDPKRRMQDLQTTGVPAPFVMCECYPVSDMDAAERAAHMALGSHRVANNREFFELPLGTLIQIVESAIAPWDQREEIRAQRLKEEAKKQAQRLKAEERARRKILEWSKRAAKEMTKAIEAAKRFGQEQNIFFSDADEDSLYFSFRERDRDRHELFNMPANWLFTLHTSPLRNKWFVDEGYKRMMSGAFKLPTDEEYKLLTDGEYIPVDTKGIIEVTHGNGIKDATIGSPHHAYIDNTAEVVTFLNEKIAPVIAQWRKPWWRRGRNIEIGVAGLFTPRSR